MARQPAPAAFYRRTPRVTLAWLESQPDLDGAWAAVALTQLALGISTLLLLVPVPLGVAHQAGALLTLTMALRTCHELSRRD